MTIGAALSVRGLRVEATEGSPLVDDVSFDLGAGEILGIVGESGSGKTSSALATLGFAHPGARLSAGTLTADGTTFDVTDSRGLRGLRGRYVSYVPQSPGTALNPSMRVGAMLREALVRRSGAVAVARPGWADLIRRTLETVQLPGTAEFLTRFPHQLSGGQQQRVCIALVLLSGAKVIILDEPTTGLDVITQASVIGELKRLREDLGLSMLYITHDLAVVSQLADRVAVMYSGSVVEVGAVSEVLRRPAHPYTRGLLCSTLDHRHRRDVQPMRGAQDRSGPSENRCSFAPRCDRAQDDCRSITPTLTELSDWADHSVRCFHPVAGSLAYAEVVAQGEKVAAPPVLSADGLVIQYGYGGKVVASVDDVSFLIRRGECLALLGESGSGKSTIARSIVGLKPRTSGSIQLNGVELAARVRDRSGEQRRRLQMVFQNSSAALNPRETVGTAIQRARVRGEDLRTERRESVERLLELVRLPASVRERFPRELSGGERQRVCIARALASAPDVLVCDEITSALDVSVQASVLQLIKELQRSLGLSLLFITHDIGVVSYLADLVIILDRGRICESGPTEQVLTTSRVDYAQRLMRAVPTLGELDAA